MLNNVFFFYRPDSLLKNFQKASTCSNQEIVWLKVDQDQNTCMNENFVYRSESVPKDLKELLISASFMLSETNRIYTNKQ